MSSREARSGIDPRSPRFVAAITATVVVVVLLTGSGWLALAQVVVFCLGAVNLRYSPYGLVYRSLVAPRLRPPAELEAPEPVRFSQALGAGFMLIATAGYFAGVPLLGAVASGAALVAALLNAVFGFCMGCEVYLLLHRLRPASR